MKRSLRRRERRMDARFRQMPINILTAAGRSLHYVTSASSTLGRWHVASASERQSPSGKIAACHHADARMKAPAECHFIAPRLYLMYHWLNRRQGRADAHYYASSRCRPAALFDALSINRQSKCAWLAMPMRTRHYLGVTALLALSAVMTTLLREAYRHQEFCRYGRYQRVAIAVFYEIIAFSLFLPRRYRNIHFNG